MSKIEEVLDILNRGVQAIEKHNAELEKELELRRQRSYNNILKSLKEED